MDKQVTNWHQCTKCRKPCDVQTIRGSRNGEPIWTRSVCCSAPVVVAKAAS